MNAGKEFLYNIDVLKAIRWIIEEWDGCPGDFI